MTTITTSTSPSINIFNNYYEYNDENDTDNILSAISTTAFQVLRQTTVSIIASTTGRTPSISTSVVPTLSTEILHLNSTTTSTSSASSSTSASSASSSSSLSAAHATLSSTMIATSKMSFPSTNSIIFDGAHIGDAVLNNTTQIDIINNRLIQATFCCLYTVIFVLGIFGNCLVCYVVLRNKAMQTVTNLFITNLALSDILLCTLAVPFTPLYTFLRRWIFGTVLCHLVPYAQGCSVYISTLTLTSIAIDRFFVIIYPFHPRMRLSTCILIILSIWIFSLLVTLPYGLYMEVANLNFTGAYTHYCEEDWPSEYYRKIFGSMTSVLQYALPFFIISFCYVCVSVRLNDRAKTKPGTKSTKKEEIERDRKRRTHRMLIAMVAVFGISWLPLNVINVINDFHTNTDEWNYYNLLFFIAHCIAMSSTCYNPFLYAWLNDNFRKEFKQVLPRVLPCFASAMATKRVKRSQTDSQRWIPEPTFNGNNETVQESLLTSSFIKSSFHSFAGAGGGSRHNSEHRESIQLNGHRNSTAYVDHSILLSDINGISPSTSATLPISTLNQQRNNHPQTHHHHNNNSSNINPETIQLPSGVLETNFEDPFDENCNNEKIRSEIYSHQPVTRIRFENDVIQNESCSVNVNL